MIETLYTFALTDEKKIERILEDANGAVNHMVLPAGESLPLHHANSNVYMAVLRGTITLLLDDQAPHAYPAGSVLTIPFKTLMNVRNLQEDIAELFVFKAPGPQSMNKK